MSGKGGWDEVMERERLKSQSAVGGAAALLADPSDNSLLPDEHSEYKASSFAASRGLVRLVCIMGSKEFRPGGKPYRAFQYVHLDSDSDFGFDAQGQVMTLRFAGMTPVTVVVRGRNLIKIWDYMQLHRIAWIREADRDFAAADAADDRGKPLPFISQIEISSILPSN